MKKLYLALENEMQKMVTTKRIIVSFSVLIVCIIISAISFKGEVTSDNWREYITDQIKQSQEWIVEYSKDLDENRELIKEEQDFILLCRFRLENNVPPVENVFKFILDSFSFETAIIMLCIIVSIFCVCNEYSNSTILILLTSGEKRIETVLAKFLTICLYNIGLIIAYFLISFFVGVIFFGKNGFSTFDIGIYNGSVEIIELLPQMVSAIIVVFFRCLFYSSLGFLIALLVKTQMIATIVTFTVWIFGGALTTVIPIRGGFQKIFVLYSLEVLSDSLVSSVHWNNSDFQRALVNVIIFTFVNIVIGLYTYLRKPLSSKYL